jgi:hypothetical protein
MEKPGLAQQSNKGLSNRTDHPSLRIRRADVKSISLKERMFFIKISEDPWNAQHVQQEGQQNDTMNGKR